MAGDVIEVHDRDKLKEIMKGKNCTCNDCPSRETCEWAYDPFNVDGDCLAEK